MQQIGWLIVSALAYLLGGRRSTPGFTMAYDPRTGIPVGNVVYQNPQAVRRRGCGSRIAQFGGWLIALAIITLIACTVLAGLIRAIAT